MILIAIVDDNKDELQALKAYIDEYYTAKGEVYVIQQYSDGVELVRSREKYNIVFLDIRMKEMGGLDAAHFLRIVNKEAQIIFVTHMAQMAIRGYEVDAMDFIVKPVDVFSVSRVLDKAMKKIDILADVPYVLKTNEGIINIATKNIFFIEIFNHDLIYHTELGEYRVRGKLWEVAEKLEEKQFIQCNRSHLVNMRHIKSINKDYIVVHDLKIPISKSRRKEIEQRFILYLGEGK